MTAEGTAGVVTGATTNGGAGNGYGREAGGQGSPASQASGGGTGHPDIPPVFVVNCQLPDIPTPFSGQGDGPTVHIIFTFRATPRLCRYAARVWADENNEAAAPAAAAAGAGSGSSGGERTGSPSGTPPAGAAAAGDAVGGAGEGDSAASGGSRESLVGLAGRASAGDAVRGGVDGDGEEGDGDVPESVRLLVEWMRHAEDDGIVRGRFKAIGDIINADEASQCDIGHHHGRSHPALQIAR